MTYKAANSVDEFLVKRIAVDTISSLIRNSDLTDCISLFQKS